MKQKVVLTLLLGFAIIPLSAQVRGVIVDKEGQLLQNVTIQNLNTQRHTHSDEKGTFVFEECKVADSLKFYLLGYRSQKIKLDATNNFLNVVLETAPLELNAIDITAPVQSNLQKIDLSLRPIQNTQEMLRIVPGLFIAQHAGGGKAEQIFLRGFDIDHGTDLAISVDGILPVNMVSHAHGQGYSDLHFLIPESIQSVEFNAGSYDASKGNFATAGSVNFKIKDRIDHTQINFETGQYQYSRLSGLVNLKEGDKSNSYAGIEYLQSSGYFDAPQDLKKLNALLKYNYMISPRLKFKSSLSYFKSSWSASGQIPEREVRAGRISRFGSIDPTEGGATARLNWNGQLDILSSRNQFIKSNSYFTHYDFQLFSNFTYFLIDSIHGDQIEQAEKRNIYGSELTYDYQQSQFKLQSAIGLRLDDIRNSHLTHTQSRTIFLNDIRSGNTTEANAYGYAVLNYSLHRLNISPQVRMDYVKMDYFDKLNSTQNGQISFAQTIVSPKFIAEYRLDQNAQLYFKTGLGFHSNDARTLILNPSANLLTRSTDIDLGAQVKLFKSHLLHLNSWLIDMEDELVYVGDEGIVESNGPTRRYGLELGFRSQILKNVFLESDIAYTHARAKDDQQIAKFVPLAVKWCAKGGINILNWNNFSGSIRYRYLGDRPATEDYSLIAKGYLLCDFNVSYKYKYLNIGVSIENITNQKWNEAQFATVSKLRNESIPVEEIHFTPGTPFNMRLRVGILL
ncbi:MAG: TonB-dependent receptor plug domain-containing protein [Saprospiraceae bacterium]